MSTVPPSVEADSRVESLRRYDILDTDPEEAFDRLVDLARQVFNVPTAFLSFLDAEREWFKARRQFERQDLSLAVSFGVHVLNSNDLTVVEDTATDDRFAENPLVTDDPGIRFYAAAPLQTSDGHRIGSIGVMDTAPQSPSTDALDQLRTLADLATEELEARRHADDHRDELDLLLDGARGNAVILDGEGTIIRASEDWRNFARENDVEDVSRVDVNINYLEVCRLPHEDPNYQFAQRARQGIEAVLRGKRKMFDLVYPCHGPDQERWFHMEARALEHPRGQALVSHANVTAAERRQRRERFLETAVEQARDAILITEATPLDEPGPRITYVNPAFTEVTGYMLDEIVGQTPRILQGPLTEPWVLDELRRKLRREEAFKGEAINYKKDGTPYVNHWSVGPVHDEDGRLTHWVSVQRDITENRQIDKRLLEAQEEERRRIAREMHDEMGGLLASLQMAVASAQSTAEEDLSALASIKDQVGDLSIVVRTLTERLHSRVLVDFGLSEALDRLADEFDEREQLDVTLQDDLPSDERLLPLIEKIAYRGIREALRNVAQHDQTDQADVLVRKNKNRLRVHVIDDGAGFDMGSDRDADGQNGLLALKKRVDRLNGNVEIDTSMEEGTQLSMTLPLTFVPSKE